MNTNAVLKQRIEEQFPGYVIQFKSVPDEKDVVSVNVFGVARESFSSVKEFIFDLEDELSVDELLVPICYTKQEVMDHYPAVATEYVLKQKSQIKKKEAAVVALAFASYDLFDCSCSKSSRGCISGFEQFFSLSQKWSLTEPQSPLKNAADESYALAA